MSADAPRRTPLPVRPRSCLAVTALAALGVAAAACGAPAPRSGPPSPATVLHRAVARTIAARSASLSLAFKRTGPGGPGQGRVTVATQSTGSFDLATGAGTVTTPLTPVTVTGAEVTMRVTADAFSWIPPASETASLPRGVTGEVVVPCDAGNLARAVPAALFQLASLTPSQYLAFLGAVSGPVRSLGRASIDGVPARGYAVVIDMEALVHEGAHAQNGTEIGRGKVVLVPGLVRAEIAYLGRTKVAARAWVDAAGRLVRFAMSSGAAGASSVSLVATFSGFGAPLPRASAPSPTAAADLETMVPGRERDASEPGGCAAGREAEDGKRLPGAG